jgi:NADP-dependent 3-hydroxy acid dehydrogenase YdfG
VSKWEEVEAVSKRIQEEVSPFHCLLECGTKSFIQIGHPTVLVNNAGVVQGKRLLDLTPEDIQQYVKQDGLGLLLVDT